MAAAPTSGAGSEVEFEVTEDCEDPPAAAPPEGASGTDPVARPVAKSGEEGAAQGPDDGVATDPLVRPARGDATQVARIQRSDSPHTEFIQLYARGPSEGDEAWAEIRALAVEAGQRSATSPTTIQTPRQRAIRRLGFLGVITALVAVIAGSLYWVSQVLSPEVAVGETDAEDGTTTGASGTSTGGAPLESPVERPKLSEQLGVGLKVEEVLAVTTKEVTRERKLVDVRLGAHVELKQVTVVNLWADWCAPCKRELGGLKDMFEGSDWGDRVRFLPVQVADPRDAVWALETYAPQMPRHPAFLSDARTRGGLLDALREVVRRRKGKKSQVALPESPELVNLPITLVFDCQRELRLFHVGELSGGDFETLKGLVGTLRAELGTKTCRRESSRTMEPKHPARCGDDRCDLGEMPATCCDCQECKEGDICVPAKREGDKVRCVKDLSTKARGKK